MHFFRHYVIRNCSSFVTGVVFLNLSFLLTEIDLAGLRQQNPVLYKSIVNLFTNTSFEEECDSGAESPTQSKVDINLITKYQLNINSYFLLNNSSLAQFISSLQLLDFTSPILLPPPEFIA